MFVIRSRPTYLGEVHPESDGPRLGRKDEGRDQGAHIWRQDDKSCPDIDLTSTLVEEEHVEDKHQPPTLRNSAEKPVQDTCSHERFKRCCCCAPCGGGGGEEEEVEEDWQSPCPCGKYDDDDAPGAKHENITNLRVINGVFTKAPDSRNKLAGMLRY